MGPSSTSPSEGLVWEGAALGELAGQLGTPAFVFSERRLRSNCARFRECLPEASFRFCVKSNSEIGVLRVIADEGFGALVSHEAELDLALAAGFTPGSIAFQRPVLSREEVSAVISRGVRRIHVHRPEDVSLLDAAAEQSGSELEVIVRVSQRTRVPLLRMAATRLGCSGDEVRSAATAIGRSKGLRLSGLSIYVGTQQAGVRAFTNALDRLIAFGRSVPGDAPFEINLGGGIPAAQTQRLTISGLASRWRGGGRSSAAPSAIMESIGREWSRLGADGRRCTLVLEPGRGLVADAAVLLTRVAAVQRDWLFVDASRNYFGEMPLLFTRPLKPVHRRSGGRRRYDISGSTLNTADIVDLRRSFDGPVEVGDILASFDAGAYSISRASRYAGLSPAVYLLGGDGEVRLIRRAETFEDLIAPMVVRTP